jgi:lysozyme
MKLSPLALAILEFLEELRLEAYQDQHAVWTCGYGHTGPDVSRGTTCTAEQAGVWLASDVGRCERAVGMMLQQPPTQREFDALVLFGYNVGLTALKDSSLLASLNAGDKSDAANDFLAWDHVQGVVNAGLLKRRKLEMALFLDV